MKREKELAEKRKNDPPLELASDHPVRKLISRFRKISDRNQNVDPEAGGHGDGGSGGGGQTPNNIAAASNHTPSAQAATVNETGGGSQSKSKWNKFLAGAAAATPGKLAGTVEEGKVIPAPPKTTAPTAVFKAGPPEPAPSLKPASRWGKMFARQPETILEKDEETPSPSGATGGHLAADMSPRESTTTTDEAALTQRDIAVSVIGRGSLTPAEHHLLQCLCDIKMEVKQEISVLNEKMTKIDDQIGSILKMFTAQSSQPTSSQTPSSISSCVTTTSGNSNVAMARSPRSSLVPSPPAAAAAAAAAAYSDYARPSSSDHPCRTITPPSPSSATDKSSSGSEASGTAKRAGRRKKGTTNRKRVAPSDARQIANADEAPTPPVGGSRDDEDRLPIKDRDLDIL